MEDAIPISTPADPGTSLRAPSKECELKVPYREAIGSLMFLAIVSRPDLSFKVNYLSRFLCNYDKSHWECLKRVLRYLECTYNHGIEYKQNECSNFEQNAYSDSDFAGD